MDDLKQKYLSQIADAADEAVLEEIRVGAVGKKGEVALKMRELGKMTPEERQVAGPALNALKDEINSAISAKKLALGDAVLDERLRTEWLDVTLPGRHRAQGTIHPVSQVTEEVTAIFGEMGFSVAEGPRIDTDWYNFDALNIPSHHPAGAEWIRFTCTEPRVMIARRMSCALIPARFRYAPWRHRARHCALSAPAASTALITTRPTRRCSIRSKDWRLINTSRWPI